MIPVFMKIYQFKLLQYVNMNPFCKANNDFSIHELLEGS